MDKSEVLGFHLAPRWMA